MPEDRPAGGCAADVKSFAPVRGVALETAARRRDPAQPAVQLRGASRAPINTEPTPKLDETVARAASRFAVSKNIPLAPSPTARYRFHYSAGLLGPRDVSASCRRR